MIYDISAYYLSTNTYFRGQNVRNLYAQMIINNFKNEKSSYYRNFLFYKMFITLQHMDQEYEFQNIGQSDISLYVVI